MSRPLDWLVFDLGGVVLADPSATICSAVARRLQTELERRFPGLLEDGPVPYSPSSTSRSCGGR